MLSKALAEAGDLPVCYDTLEKGHEWAVLNTVRWSGAISATPPA